MIVTVNPDTVIDQHSEDDDLVWILASKRDDGSFEINAKTTPAPPPIEVLESLDAVLTYLWEKEESDYEQQDHDGQAHHVFREMGIVNDWMAGGHPRSRP